MINIIRQKKNLLFYIVWKKLSDEEQKNGLQLFPTWGLSLPVKQGKKEPWKGLQLQQCVHHFSTLLFGEYFKSFSWFSKGF